VRTTRRSLRGFVAVFAALALAATACGNGEEETADPAPDETPETAPDADEDGDADEATDGEVEEGDDEATGPITVYSGRNEELVSWVFDDFTAETGIEVEVRYGDTAELASTILEEGDASPADVYFAQDAGALGALEAEGRFTTLPDDILDLVDGNFRAPSGAWTGVTGRVRVLAWNTDALTEDELPDSVFDLTDPEWQGRVGWAPTNGSFQAFVTAMRVTEGDDATRDWLEGMLANDPVVFSNNTGAVEGVARGEAEIALVNHYYLYRFLAEDPDFNVANHYLPGDIGGLVNIAGVGILSSSDNQAAAEELVRFLLGEEVQAFFGQETDALEFPLVEGIDSPELPSLESLDPPQVDLSRLEDLQGTLELLNEVGAFE
jgi:iron(III) transport system substrate-binding protein